MTMREWALICFVAGALCGGLVMHRRNGVPVLSTRIDTLRVVEHKLDTIYRTRRVRMDSIITMYEAVRVTDTVMRADTVYVRRSFTDSIAMACRAVTQTCDTRIANLKTQLSAMDTVVAQLIRRERMMPYFVAGGFVLGVLLAR